MKKLQVALLLLGIGFLVFLIANIGARELSHELALLGWQSSSQPSSFGSMMSNDRVVIYFPGFKKTILAILGLIHGIAFLAQRFYRRAEQTGFIFNYQNSHVQFYIPVSQREYLFIRLVSN